MVSMLEIKDLRVIYKVGKKVAKALNGVTFSIGRGEALGLVGESGAGKTTTALSIMKLLPERNARIIDGSIVFDSVDIITANEAQMKKLRGKEIAMVFQNPLTSLNPVFTVGEQIDVVLRKHTKLSAKERKTRIYELLEAVGINRVRIDDYPHEFSGGMRQRVGIAAALACNPSLIIADEPTTALDVTIQAQILELIKELMMTYSTSLLMITHNLGIVGDICERVAVMYAGRIVEIGSVQEVYTEPMHPYTKSLFASIPDLKGERKPLSVIPGNVASALNLPSGCAFHPRCAYRMDICKVTSPQQIKVSDNHFVACYCYTGCEENG
jgi:peptide/nickel transport system ATP-binding protein